MFLVLSPCAFSPSKQRQPTSGSVANATARAPRRGSPRFAVLWAHHLELHPGSLAGAKLWGVTALRPETSGSHMSGIAVGSGSPSVASHLGG